MDSNGICIEKSTLIMFLRTLIVIKTSAAAKKRLNLMQRGLQSCSFPLSLLSTFAMDAK
jgi:hypothetical protein